MTDLTDKWRKGELPEGDYYIERYADSITFDNVDKEGIWRNTDTTDVTKVLAKVPSYTELQSMNEAVNQAMAANIKLVEKLKIAVKALEKYADKKQWQSDMAMPIIYREEDTGYGDAQDALQKIKELDNE